VMSNQTLPEGAADDASKNVLSTETLDHGISPLEVAANLRTASATARLPPTQDNYLPGKGSRLSFTFDDGLLVQILPNGDVSQMRVTNADHDHARHPVIHDTIANNLIEKSRLITRAG